MVKTVELLALRWSDWEGDYLHIRQTLSSVDNRLIFGTPKTARSKRSLPLPRDVKEVLEQRRTEQALERNLAKRWTHHNLIFSSTVGTPTNPNNLRKVFKRLIEQAAVKKIRVHDSRHTWVTLVRDAGLDAEVVAELAGHDVRMTMAVYSKVTEERKRKAALGLENLLK